MTICPSCGHENIAGVDECEECQHSLTHLSRPRPASVAEQRIVRDALSRLKRRPLVMVSPETSVGEVLDLLVRERIGCVVVARGGATLGIFSERDALIRIGVRFADLLDRPISEFMTPNPVTLGPEDKIAFALHTMDLGGYRHVPLVADGQAVGIVSVRDILRYLTEEILNAPAA